MDPNSENKKHRITPEYAQYQRENFWLSNEGKVPVFNTGMSHTHPLVTPLIH